jgi:hypothetical protein
MRFRSYLPQFSIRQLFIWTAFIGFACVSLRSASETWVAIAFAVVLMIIGVMPMLVILRSGADRAYWVGFAVIGSLYLGLLMYSFALEPNTVNSNPLSAGNLATARLARCCHRAIYGELAMANQLVFTVGMPATQYSVQLEDSGLITLNPATIDVDVAALRASSLRTGTVRWRMPVVATAASPKADDFVNVAHALWTLVLAACGAWFARWLYRSQSRMAQATGTVTTQLKSRHD